MPNIKVIAAKMKKRLARSCVGLWCENGTHGSGYLLNFRGERLVVSCEHVLGRMDGVIYVTFERENFQRDKIHRNLQVDSNIDAGFMHLNHDVSVEMKNCLDVSNDVYLGDVAKGEAVWLQGFPGGFPGQRGFQMNREQQKVTMKSMTYLSITEDRMRNQSLKNIIQPTMAWIHHELRDLKEFKNLPERIDARGFSGGPVFLDENKKLIGHVTHVGKGRLFYTPIAQVLEFIERNYR